VPETTGAPVPAIQPRGTCIQEDFSTLNFNYFTAKACPQQMSILNGGYLNLHMVQSCSNVRIDSKNFFSNAYVEARMKLGGQGPDFSGVVYAFYSDGIITPGGNHADEIDVEIVGNGNPGRGWFQNSAQLGVWVPNYVSKQYLTNVGSYDFASDFHVFAFQWNQDVVDFFIDGEYRYSSSMYEPSIGYTQPEKVIFSLWDGTPFPDFSKPMNWGSPQAKNFNMIIDYVKICY
jgi:beta-glucanase (GH16 family)